MKCGIKKSRKEMKVNNLNKIFTLYTKFQMRLEIK